jgi:hypothetical protein
MSSIKSLGQAPAAAVLLSLPLAAVLVDCDDVVVELLFDVATVPGLLLHAAGPIAPAAITDPAADAEMIKRTNCLSTSTPQSVRTSGVRAIGRRTWRTSIRRVPSSHSAAE